MTWSPCLVRAADRGSRPVLRLGHPQLDRYLEFVSARARPNTTLAAAKKVISGRTSQRLSGSFMPRAVK